MDISSFERRPLQQVVQHYQSYISTVFPSVPSLSIVIVEDVGALLFFSAFSDPTQWHNLGQGVFVGILNQRSQEFSGLTFPFGESAKEKEKVEKVKSVVDVLTWDLTKYVKLQRQSRYLRRRYSTGRMERIFDEAQLVFIRWEGDEADMLRLKSNIIL